MADYATLAEAQARYGLAHIIESGDRDGDGNEDTSAVAAALSDATAEIDTYLGRVVDLPLASPPAVLKRMCVDVAVYRLSAEAGPYTKEKRQRYEDTIRQLEMIADGTLSLGLDDPPASVSQQTSVAAEPRVFTRTTMGGIV
jgi:phage gp36-like protein